MQAFPASLQRHFAVGLAALLALAGATLIAAAPASATTRRPATPTGLPTAIESMTPYVGQTSCDPTVKPGTAKFATLLARTYPGTAWSSAYQCGTDGSRSEHYEGRAIDWMVSIHNAAQHADASAVIAWLLATDSHGNKFAMARRLGVMYVIFNNRIWGTWSGWQPYNNCAKQPQAAYDNACHRTHMHISLSWNGAMGATSFWTKKVSPTDYGPCRPSDLNWASARRTSNPTPCPRYRTIGAPAGASALKKQLVIYAGAGVNVGMSGPAVRAVQSRLHVSVTGFYGVDTSRVVQLLQRAHHQPVGGAMTPNTWRVLLAITK